MPKQILFVQGGGEGAHDEWDQKLVDNLCQHLGSGYAVHYPRMPQEDDPQFEAWKDALHQEISELNEDAILIGHSIGGTILINTLADPAAQPQPGAIILISAPYVGEGGWPAEGFEAKAKLGPSLPQGLPVHLFHGSDDDTAPITHADLYKKSIPQAVVHRLDGRDHQLNNDLTEVAEVVRALA